MKTLADIRSGVTKRAKGEEGLHQTKIATTPQGQRLLITEAEVAATKKTTKLQEVAEEKRTEITNLDDEFARRKEEALASIDRIVSEATKRAKEIVGLAEAELITAQAAQQQNEKEKELLNEREQNMNKMADDVRRTSLLLDERGQKIVATESEIAARKSAIVKAHQQSQELVASLAAVLMAALDRIEAMGRLNESADVDLSKIIDTFSTVSKIFSDWHMKLTAKEERTNQREEQINADRRILRNERTRLRMVKGQLE